MKLIDQFLSECDFRNQHKLTIPSSNLPDASILYEIDFSDSFLIRLLFFLRGLPSRMHHIKGFFDVGFILLQENQHEIVMGLISQPWKMNGVIRKVPSEEFIDFHEPGYIKATANFLLEKMGSNHILLKTETRIACTSRASMIYFSIYWTLIRFFSGLVRKEILKLIKQRIVRNNKS